MLTRIIVALAGATALSAQGEAPESRYTKRIAMVPMRDGTKLHTQIFEPKDRSKKYPILFSRSPYGMRRYDTKIARRPIGPSKHFDDSGYVFVYQDVRGQFRSEGTFEVLRPPRTVRADPRATDETTDAYDTIEWLLKDVTCDNGRVGMWGISYAAWQTVMAMADAHPALVAVSPQASPADMFRGDDIHHNGAFRLHYMFRWLAIMGSVGGHLTGKRGDRFDFGTNNAYEYFLRIGPLRTVDEKVFRGKLPTWTEYMTHGTYDHYWRRRNPLRILQHVRPAALHVAGWFDAEDFRGTLDIYHRTEVPGREAVNALVVGPWRHGGWNRDRGDQLGRARFGSSTAQHFRDRVEFPFFEFHLKAMRDPALAPVTAFETGGNRWHHLAKWPPDETRPTALFLRPGGIAGFAPAVHSDAVDDPGYDEFVSDPANPVPSAANPTIRYDSARLVEDQSFVLEREDVLTYTSEPLTEDLVIAGQVKVQLAFTTTGTDADWIVKLIDVHPGKKPFRMLTTADIFRAKFRDDFAKPKAIAPGEVTTLQFHLPDRLHRFRQGHRLMVQIHSTWFPTYDRNPQSFVDIYHAPQSAFRKETHRIYRRGATASRLILPVWAK